MSQEIPLAPGLLKDFTAFAQVVLPDPPAGHHNLALHFFDHDGREAGRILFHHIPLFHSYGALPSLVSKGSCYAVIQSSNQAGARIVTVSEEDHQSQNGGKQSGWVLRRSSLNKPKFQWMYLQMYLLFLNLKMDVSANGDSDFGLGNYHFQVHLWFRFRSSWPVLIRGLFAVDPQKLLTIARSRKILKHHAVQILAQQQCASLTNSLWGGGWKLLRLRILRVGFWGVLVWIRHVWGRVLLDEFGQGSAFRSKFLENSNKGSAIQQEGFEGRFQGRLCCWKVLAKVAGRVVVPVPESSAFLVAQCRI